MGHSDAGVRCTVIRDTAMDCCFYILLEYVGGHNMQMVVLFHTHTHSHQAPVLGPVRCPTPCYPG